MKKPGRMCESSGESQWMYLSLYIFELIVVFEMWQGITIHKPCFLYMLDTSWQWPFANTVYQCRAWLCKLWVWPPWTQVWAGMAATVSADGSIASPIRPPKNIVLRLSLGFLFTQIPLVLILIIVSPEEVWPSLCTLWFHPIFSGFLSKSSRNVILLTWPPYVPAWFQRRPKLDGKLWKQDHGSLRI